MNFILSNQTGSLLEFFCWKIFIANTLLALSFLLDPSVAIAIINEYLIIGMIGHD